MKLKLSTYKLNYKFFLNKKCTTNRRLMADDEKKTITINK